MSPQGRKRAALMISRDQPATIGSTYQTYRKVRQVWFLISIQTSLDGEGVDQFFFFKIYRHLMRTIK